MFRSAGNGRNLLSVNEITRKAWEFFEPELAGLGYELIEVEFARQDAARVLRVYIDKDGGGITLDDCTAASQLLSPLLDANDFVGSEYLLEVSSPGFDRPVRKPEHFVRYAGEPVKLLTHAPVAGRSRFTGTLLGYEDGLVLLEVDGQSLSIHSENVKKAKLNR